MNPELIRPSDTPAEADLWDDIQQAPGTEPREALEFVHQRARRCEGIIVLNSPSPRVAVSAVLGAVQSCSKAGPARVYLIDPHRSRLMLLFHELNKATLSGEVTLYHGSIARFFRDLPLSIDLLCTGVDPSTLGPGLIQSAICAGSRILTLRAPGESVSDGASQHPVQSGLLEVEEVRDGGIVYRATQLCRGPNYVPRTTLRITLQRRLHERYFLSEAKAETNHTPVADLTQEIRREFSRQFPGASGLGAWPHAAPEPCVLPLTLPSGRPWPKISIVTPTRNQGFYIEETILSVLHQNYPNVEYIIIDGASTDDTAAVLERYHDRLALVVSEPDRGQSNAINKGMEKTTGDILTWLNSDDMLAPGALTAAAIAFDTNNADMIAGICRLYRDGVLEKEHLTSCPDGELPLNELLDLDQGWNAGQFFVQPDVMFTRDIWQRSGGYVDEKYFFSMDYELWLRFAHAGARLHVIGRPLAWFRKHEEQKTHAWSKVLREQLAVRDAFANEHGLQLKTASTGAPWREKLRITLLNDIGGLYGAGVAQLRLARALASAGHDVEIIAILEAPGQGSGTSKVSSRSVLDRVSASRPDLVIVGNLHGANADPVLLHLLSERFHTLVVLHDFWILTGRCAYTGECEKYLTGCDETCPTPNEYPALAASKIAGAWRKKRQVLTAKARPALLANSEWTAAFARQAVSAISPRDRAPAVELFRLSFPLEAFRPRDKQACREHLGLPLDRFLVLVPASLDETRKGARALLEALARLELPNVLVITIGWPSSDLDFAMEVLQLGYIADQHKVAMLNSAVDVVVAPSSAETFGQIFIEAIACGTPVVGYPVAAVPEAIRDGVTGLVASDNNPESLAAAIHHLYIHPELRSDLAKWGRLYVENEWSEASAYQHFFVALQRLGLAKSLKLRRKIEFLPTPAEIASVQHITAEALSWRPYQGFSPIEQAAEYHLESFRWAYGPAAYAEIFVDMPGAYHILIAYRNPHEGQSLKLRLNGELLGIHQLANTGLDSGHVLMSEVEVRSPRNLLHFEFSRWYRYDQNIRPLAIIVTEILLEKVRATENDGPFPIASQRSG